MTEPVTTPWPGLALSKDDGEFPVPVALRGTISSLVDAFAAGDFLLKDHLVMGIEPISPDLAQQVEASVSSYGDALVRLDEGSWDTSVYSWQGDGWILLVDLTTAREKRSDLVLFLNIGEGSQEIEVRSVHVP